MTDKTLQQHQRRPRRRQQQQPHRRPRGPVLMQDIWLMEKLAHFDRGTDPGAGGACQGSAPTAPLP